MDSFFDRALMAARRLGASDVHLKPGLAPILRIAGELRTLSDVPPLSREFLQSLGLSLLNDRRREILERTGDVVVALATSTGGRQRVHIFHHRGGFGLSLRLIPPEAPALATLGLPPQTGELMESGAGLVVVAGGSGQGKTTTLAALLDDLAGRRPCRVLTIEDPVEYLLRDRRGVVVQREVGTDAPSSAAALRSAARQDLDVLVVGELAEAEAIRLALEAAETGRLVLAGMTAGGLAPALEKLTGFAGPEGTVAARARVAAVLRGMIFQKLVPLGDGKRRGPTGTFLRVGPETRARIAAPPEGSELPGSFGFEAPTEPTRRRRAEEERTVIEDDAAGD